MPNVKKTSILSFDIGSGTPCKNAEKVSEMIKRAIDDHNDRQLSVPKVARHGRRDVDYSWMEFKEHSLMDSVVATPKFDVADALKKSTEMSS
jgi:hypothetical protein